MKWLLFFPTTLVGLGASCGGLIAEPTPTPPDDAPMCHRAHDLQAGEPPACPPRGIEFTNTTDDPAYIAGTVTVRHVIDEADIICYKVYWGKSPTESVGTWLKDLQANGTDPSFTWKVSDQVKRPAGVDYLLAVSCNSNGETGYAAVKL